MSNFVRISLTAIAASLAFTASADAVPKKTATVKLLTDTVARSYPGDDAPAVADVAARRPLTNQATTLPVLDTAKADDGSWVRVLLPQRPNGSTGWIPANGTVAGSTPYRAVVNRRARTTTIYKSGKTFRKYRVVIGAKGTPTPAGHFFVAEVVRQHKGAQTGPYVLATSAYSNVLKQFGGGPGQIGLHGRTGLSDPLGSAASHGCVRFSDKSITYLASILVAGTPIDIR